MKLFEEKQGRKQQQREHNLASVFMLLDKQLKRKKRHRRVRSKIKGTRARPRLCVFRSNRYIYAQLIDDEKRNTLVSVSTQEVESKSKKLTRPNFSAKNLGGLTKVQASYEVGKLLAQKANKKKVAKVIFDRGGFKYHGRVKALAQGAREGGLKF